MGEVGTLTIDVRVADRGFCNVCRNKRRSSFPMDTKFKDNFIAHIAGHISKYEEDETPIIRPETKVVGGNLLVTLVFEGKL